MGRELNADAAQVFFGSLLITLEEQMTSTLLKQLQPLLTEAVRLRAATMSEAGGPGTQELQQVDALSQAIGDAPLFMSKKDHKAAHQFNALAEVLAILSFCPGGVHAFGLHFEQAKDAGEVVTAPHRQISRTVQSSRISAKERRIELARCAAKDEAQRIITSWGEERPLQGYNQLCREIGQMLSEYYSDLSVEVRVLELQSSVCHAAFEALLPDYERIYGQEAVRSSWAALTGCADRSEVGDEL
jgi:hypothetical protein